VRSLDKLCPNRKRGTQQKEHPCGRQATGKLPICGRATLMETAPGVSVADVIANTEAELVIPAEVPEMAISA
ncbi:MAG: hypothetical protein WAK08_27210, partial [Pseudolabrys sp.]